VAVATIVLASVLVGVVAGSPVASASAADAVRYNPWGFQNEQVLTEAEASAVILHQVNLQRSLIGLPPLVMSNDRSGAQCSVAAIAQTGIFRHYQECIPANHYENIYGSYSTGRAVVEAAGPWTTSTSGHNEAMYATNTTHAQVSVRCNAGGEWPTQGFVAFQPVNTNGYTSARSSRANVAVLQQTDALYAATGVACDGSTLRFRLHPDLRVAAPYLVPGERAIDVSQPEVWHRYQVARLYAAYFDRAPDHGGWAFWNRQIVDGMTLWRASDFFADSPEFKTTYGASLTDTEFLHLVYENVLDRAPDSGGLQYWRQRMANGMTRGQVMVHFSESIEYIGQMAPDLTGSCWNGEVSGAYLCAAPNTVRPS
jgi:hypothetical protein